MGSSRRDFLRSAAGTAIALTATPRQLLAAPSAADLYVSPTGDDTAPGTVDRPLRTLPAAQQMARAHHLAPATIHLRAGTHYLRDTLILTPADNHTTWQAYRDEDVTLSGGQLLSLHWQSDGSPIVFAKVPAGLRTDQLFVNGQRQVLARYPNFDPSVTIFNGYAADTLDPTRTARYKHPEGATIHAMHEIMWGSLHYTVTGRNPNGALALEGGWQTNRPAKPHKQYRFIENVREELDAPGEWFLDTTTDTLYFYPPPGLSLSQLQTATIEVPRLKSLIELRGSSTAPVTDVVFHNITFRHALRTFMETREPLLRSDWAIYRGGAFFLQGTLRCTVTGCTFDRLGGNAIFFSNFNRNSRVSSCEIFEAGASGVCFVGDPAAVRNPLFKYEQHNDLSGLDLTPGPRTSNYPQDCTVEDTLIHRIGRVEKQAAGVEISMSSGITVHSCSIYDVPRAGINIGDGCWGGHTIADCDVFDTVKESGDHGSFNAWGRDRYWQLNHFDLDHDAAANHYRIPLLDTPKPITLRHSRWRCDHGWDIDLDDGSTNYHIVDNLCLHGGLKLREGFLRTAENNILVNNTLSAHVWFQDSGDIFRNNIVFTPYKPVRIAQWGQEVDHNLLHTSGLHPAVPATQLEALTHQDAHSLQGDALFINPAAGDYRVRTDSSALTCGFRNFPMDGFGVTSPRLRAKARTPELPAAAQNSTAKRTVTVLDWQGAKVRDLIDEGEMSVYGAPGITGALLIAIPAEGPAAIAGLHPNDLILHLGNIDIKTAADLVAQTNKLPHPTQTIIEGLRNQRPLKLAITLT